ncbi:Larval serum protein 1 gamma chain [Rhizoctonia solani]|uniref:Larval serum protein 1 gamma chain n=1 Tax=Rhizoctonia solani TaxID=456999 RepID=A0A0K6G6E3_9AGAM|nr:Larval serum protein 1 gamma chain [Rhizoctonia solani]
MSTSTIKKLAAQLRPISSLDSGSRAPSQESEKGFNQYNGDERARTQSMTEGSSHAETTVDMDITPQLPSSYYLGFKSCNQFWDQAKDQWTETYRVAPAENPPVSNRVMAYKRKSSVFPHSNHIWIEIRGSTLFELLRPYFQSFSDFTGIVPGTDARHIYMQRKALQELIPRPTKHQVLSSADRTMYTDLQHLLDYIEQEFADVTLELEHMKQEEDPHIRWDFLWALLAPGELLETKESVFGLDMVFKPKNWLYMTPNPDYSKPSYTQIRNSDLLPVFQVQGEFLEWTGRGYTSIWIEHTVQKYTIHTYLGIQTVNSHKEIQFYGCAVKPTSYKLSGVYHFNYHSYIMWEESDNDCAYAVYKGTGPQSQIRKAQADGRVMIDMMSFRRFNPDRDVWNTEDLSDSSSQMKRESPSLDENSPDLCLLPPMVFGWSFELRKWGQFMVEKLSPITFEPNTFSHLVLPEDDKEFIKALVEAQAVSGEVPAFEDVVPGKGSRLVMLFHGSTGTGKTLTAEAISEHLQLLLWILTLLN